MGEQNSEQMRAELNELWERLGKPSFTSLGVSANLTRQAVSAAIQGTGNTSSKTFADLHRVMEEILEDRKEGPKKFNASDVTPFRIHMRGVYGIGEVVFEGSPEESDDVRRQAVEFVREVQEGGPNGSHA